MNSLRKIRISVSFAILVLMLTIGGANVFAQDTAETAERVNAEAIENSRGEKTPEETDAITGGLGASGFEAITATTYAFAATTAALEDMSTGTTQLVGPGLDDTASAVTNIGFDFWYDGARYNQFSCNANGLCRLGGAAVSTSFDNASATTGFASTTNAPKIAPYYDDLWVGTNGKIHFKVIGAAGSRKLVVEFQNMTIPRQTTATTGMETFQMWLFESASTTTPGVIEFVYGDGIVANAANGGYTVGLQSGAATNLASVTTSTNTVSYTTANNTQTDAIASGTAYTFTPNIPAAPTNATTSATAVSVTLNWTDNATNEFGYVIYRSLDGINFTFLTQLAANTTTYTDTAVVPSTSYTYQIFAVTEGALSNPPLVASQSTTAPGNDTCAGAGGNYSNPATWADGTVPTAGDNVTIQTGCTVTVDTANAVAFNLTIDSGGTLQGPATGTASVLTVGANLTNNGTLNLSANATTGAVLVFTGATNNTWSGTGTNNIRTLRINKGAGTITPTSPTLEINVANLTNRGSSAGGLIGFLDTATFNGILKISGTNTFSDAVFQTSGYSIPTTAGFWLNNPNFTVLGLGGSPLNNGLLRISQGTFNVGTGSGNSLGAGTGAQFIIEGGTLNTAGRLQTTSAVTYNQSGGTVNVCTVGNTATTACFGLTSTTSTIIMSGGTIVLVQRNTNAAPLDYSVGSTIIGTVGTTLQVGNAATATNFDFRIRGNVPRLTIDNTITNKSVLLAAQTNQLGNVLLNPGTTLNLNGFIWLIITPTITNNGTITATLANSRFYFLEGAGATTYNGTGTATLVTASGSVDLTMDNPAGLIIDPASGGIITQRVNFFRGGITGSNKLTCGNGGTTVCVLQYGLTGGTNTAGNFDVAPTFNIGTGGQIILYNQEGTARTTSVEINPTRVVLQITVNNTNGLTIAGGDITVNGFLVLTNGVVTAGSNVLIYNGLIANATRTNGYVDGNLRRVFAAAETFTFFVGQNGYSPVTANVSTLTTNPSSLTVKAVDTTLPGLSPSLSASRFWSLTETGDLAATLAFTYIDPADVNGNEANYRLFRLAGTLSEVPATVDPATNTATTTNPITEFSDWGIGVLAVPGTLQFNAATYSALENAGTITVTVNRTGGTDGTVTVNYATVGGGSATGGASCTPTIDFIPTTGTLTFVAGDDSETFNITICPDSDIEPDETINLTLTNATGGATIGTQNTAVATITNDDLDTTAPTVIITQAAGQTDPTTAATVNFTVTFNEPVTGFGAEAGDVIVSGTAFATGSTPTVVVTGNGTTYNVAVSGYTQNGTVIINVPAGAAQDAAGNDNTASDPAQGDNTITVFPGATTLYVDDDGMASAGGCDTAVTGVSTIQAAVDASAAGNTIQVCPGTYPQNVTVNKPLTILGPNANIDPNTGTRVPEAILLTTVSNPVNNNCDFNTDSNIVTITAENAVVRGFTFDGDNPTLTSTFNFNGANIDAYAGIYEQNVANPNADLSYNIVKNTGEFGIIIGSNDTASPRTNSTISHNRLDNVIGLCYGEAIRIGENAYANVTDNTVTRSFNGVTIENFNNSPTTRPTSTIGTNQIQAYGYAIYHNLHYSYSGNGFTISNNTINSYVQANGGFDKFRGIMLESIIGQVPVTIINNRILPDRSALIAANYTRVDGIFITNPSTDSPNIAITSNQVSNSFRGISHVAPAVPTLTCNSISGNDVGLYVGTDTAFGGTTSSSTNGINVITNNFTFNTAFGLQNDSPFMVNAENNYWNSTTGPTTPANPGGTGDRVSPNVDFDPFATAPTCGPTASGVTLSGRVSTSGGRGIAKVKLTLTNSQGVARTITSGRGGNFSFTDVAAGETYVLTIGSRNYQFNEPTRVLTVNESISGIDFIAY